MTQFNNTYAALGDAFYERRNPSPASNPKLIKFNTKLADTLGWDERTADVFAGNTVPKGADPIALAYAGHQFGHFNPQLGDGRAVLLGEVKGFDVQLKGSGRTKFSRGGDGKAALGPVLREYLMSEAMNALGVPTTRALAAVTTGDRVQRETGLPGAVVTRVAASHLRVGTFQYFAARQEMDNLRTVADYAIERHYPHRKGDYLGLLKEVVAAQARLVSEWMRVGFVHGVMNTDNFSISGETIDYGPCAFIDTYDPEVWFSSIDQQGRYAFGNQSGIAQWNLVRFAECLLPFFDDDDDRSIALATEVIGSFAQIYGAENLKMVRRKTGLMDEVDGDEDLIHDIHTHFYETKADYTNAFRNLGTFSDTNLQARWDQRQSQGTLSPQDRLSIRNAANPVLIPRNHSVEAALAAAHEDDMTLFDRLETALAEPYVKNPKYADLQAPPSDGNPNFKTFCGT